MPADRVLRVEAFAKINLTLRVLGVRADGYHELRTTFQTLTLHDTLTVLPARGPLRLECDDPACPTDRTNLIWQAAERLWRAARRRGAPRGALLRLRKRVPMQAGLGGGSSDAAAALRALAVWWRMDVRDADLAAIGAGLGADVPFFFAGGTALGVERGDLLFPLPDAPVAWVTIVRPDFGVSTRDAYAWWDQMRKTRRAARPAAARTPAAARLPLPPGELVNDLQAPVAARHPLLARLIRSLEREGAWYAAMSGSGSAVFGLFDTQTRARRAAAALSSVRLSTLVARTLGRREFRTRAAAKGLPVESAIV